MWPTGSPAYRYGRVDNGVTSRFNDYTSGAGPSLPRPCDQYSSHTQCVSSQQPAHSYPRSCTSQLSAEQSHANLVQYPYNQHQPYHANNNVYIQQYATQHMASEFSNDGNRVCVSDGYSWREYNQEKVSPVRFLAKNLPAGGHNWERSYSSIV